MDFTSKRSWKVESHEQLKLLRVVKMANSANPGESMMPNDLGPCMGEAITWPMSFRMQPETSDLIAEGAE